VAFAAAQALDLLAAVGTAEAVVEQTFLAYRSTAPGRTVVATAMEAPAAEASVGAAVVAATQAGTDATTLPSTLRVVGGAQLSGSGARVAHWRWLEQRISRPR
jgi:hypothetical protein